MNRYAIVAIVLTLAVGAHADKPVIDNPSPLTSRVECVFEHITHNWNFASGDQGFTTDTCDDTGGEPVWSWGAESHLGNCWGTVLDGDYPSNAGEALVSPAFTVRPHTMLVEVVHYYDTEFSYDGCNLMVNDTVVAPMAGYDDDELNDSDSFYAYCVEGEPGFSGHDLDDWVLVANCFDISAWMDQEVQLKFQFGSDSSVQYPGWYITRVKVGGEPVVASEPASWSTIKALHR